MFIDALQETYFTLKQNKLRTFLTAFGVFWGIFLLILLLGAGTGLKNGAVADFQTNAQDSVWIWSRKTSLPYKGMAAGRRIKFTQGDVDAIKKEIPGVLWISSENPVGSTNGGDVLITHEKRFGKFGVFGVGDDYFKIKIGQEYHAGRRINSLDEYDTRKIAVIGTLVRERLFPNENPIGKFIEINNISFRVVGLFYDSERNGRSSERIYIPLSVYQPVFGRGKRELKILTYQPKPDYDPYEVERQVGALLKQRHRVSPDDRGAIRLYNSLEQAERTRSMFSAINLFIWFVGVGTLMAGVVGISNIMMITVKERTVEIGVRKAMGATPASIVFSLLFESVLVTGIAGYMGLVCGVGLVELSNYLLNTFDVNTQYFKRPEVNFDIAISSIVILVTAGMLAGFAPAWKAAKISPVEAMRSE